MTRKHYLSADIYDALMHFIALALKILYLTSKGETNYIEILVLIVKCLVLKILKYNLIVYDNNDYRVLNRNIYKCDKY